MGPDKEIIELFTRQFCTQTCLVGTHWNHLIKETPIISIHNIYSDATPRSPPPPPPPQITPLSEPMSSGATV